MMPAQGAVLENKKGDSRNGYPLEMGTKKGKGTPISIRGSFACDFLYHCAGYLPQKARLTLYQTE
jgi:hypothetical protein